MALSNDGSGFPTFVPLRRADSAEQRLNAFHSERRTGADHLPLDRLRGDHDAEDGEEERSLKVARADAVEFVVKAFAAVDRNLALAEKARLQQEKHQAAAEKLRAEAEKEVATARHLRDEAEREMASARSLAEQVLSAARAESTRIVEAARARSRDEAESAKRHLVESLGPLRDLIGRAGGTIDALVATANLDETEQPAVETIDVRQSDEGPSRGATLVALPSISD